MMPYIVGSDRDQPWHRTCSQTTIPRSWPVQQKGGVQT